MGRLLVLESLLLTILLLLAFYALWETSGAILGLDRVRNSLTETSMLATSDAGFFLLEWIGICCLPIVVYWVLQYAGMTRLSFWAVTLAALVPQIPAVLFYNQLDWPSFWIGSWFTTGLSQTIVATMVLASLALLASLHRTGELRRLKARLDRLRPDELDRKRVIAGELLLLGGLIGLALVLTVLLLGLGVAVAQMEGLFVLSPWTVLTVGGAAVLLLAWVLSLWLRWTDEE